MFTKPSNFRPPNFLATGWVEYGFLATVNPQLSALNDQRIAAS
jgi:hypothetical protein